MDSRRNELKVGIAVLLSLIMLVGGIMWGKGYRLRAARYTIVVVFDNVGGLESGSNVLSNGVVKGRVGRIELREGKVYVTAAVDKTVTLYKDYKITIESPTVMAGKVVSLYPGSVLPPADISMPLTGESPMGVTEAVEIFESISSDFQKALINLNTLVTNLNLIAGDSANRKNVADILADSRKVTHSTSELLEDNRARLTGSVAKLDSALRHAQQLLRQTETRMDNSLSGFDAAMAEITQLSASLNTAVDQINRGEGTMGKMLSSDELWERLNRTLAEVDSLAHSIRTKGLRNRIVLF